MEPDNDHGEKPDHDSISPAAGQFHISKRTLGKQDTREAVCMIGGLPAKGDIRKPVRHLPEHLKPDKLKLQLDTQGSSKNI